MNMPVGLLQIYIQQMPIIEAQENLRWVQVISVGNGMYKKQALRRIIREWRIQARRGQGRQPKRKMNQLEFTARMSQIGIPFTEIPAPAPEQ